MPTNPYEPPKGEIKSLTPFLVVVAVLLMLGGYGLAYLWGTYEEWPMGGASTLAWRCYPTKLQADIFWPAAKIESCIRGHRVLSLNCNPGPRPYVP